MKLQLSSGLFIVLYTVVVGWGHEYRDDDDSFCGTRSPTRDERALLQERFDVWKKGQTPQTNGNDHRVLGKKKDYRIPLQFSVFEAQDGRGNISDAELNTLVDAVNDGFRETPFSFTISAPNEPATTLIFDAILRRVGIYGVADFPAENFTVLDGVILMNPILPKKGVTFNYMEGILTHEVGHWLGLYHTFEGGCESNSGDQVEDTPAHAKQTSRSADPNFNCWQNMSPAGPLNTCPDDVEGVDPGLDPVDNFMNYIAKRGSGEKGECYDAYGRFSPGQIERMTMMYETFRMTETPTTNISSTPSSPPMPTAGFESATNITIGTPTLAPANSSPSSPILAPTAEPAVITYSTSNCRISMDSFGLLLVLVGVVI